MTSLRLSRYRLGLSLTLLLFLCAFAAPAFSDSIKNNLDSSFTLFGLDTAGNTFALTPETTLHVAPLGLSFAASVPPGWIRGLITFQLSFDDQIRQGSTSMFGGAPFCNANAPCFFFTFGDISIRQKYPALLTLSYGGANGATETAKFMVAPAPEPGTLMLSGTGVLLLLVWLYRARPTNGLS